ncbi:hypothetical protein EV191_11370 [Tamaricihabitans halophyticus]|uniref:Uncharacterized protein n=1 Tax=Tamaricihabitans halophyticus TaxID=1262583 RepID=A0A4R2QCN7_9PSEU|nr:hypothetical protein [Tamaricihabitans halophyticus]TCP46793.1 hypothetical protein EV191_11370 [Tamaricihabitans halophyticus]
MTVEPITVNYVSSDGGDWKVTVTGGGQELTGQAPGIIAARDRADQLIEKVAPNEEGRTAVHLLNGDALEFTTAYINARIGRTDATETDYAETDYAEPGNGLGEQPDGADVSQSDAAVAEAGETPANEADGAVNGAETAEAVPEQASTEPPANGIASALETQKGDLTAEANAANP